ncbi:MAG: patatin-like phospholipase family protein [Treponema sp.]|nr:patatin-like phospholipase family protein [Treponema sp.]
MKHLQKIIAVLCFYAAAFSIQAQNKNNKTPKVALVLSGGGAKGLAEIPLIEALEEEGIKPDMILGTSMGALLGSLYAAGYSPKEIRETALSLDMVDIISEWPVPDRRVPAYAFSTHNDNLASFEFSLLNIKLGSAPGVLGDQKILVLLDSLLAKVGGIEDFDQLSIPYRAVTTDVSTGKELILKNGSLVKAVRGSMSLPGVWVPARMDDGTYVMDGGLENNLPVRAAKEMGADIIIAMDVASSIYKDPTTLDDLVSTGIQIFNLIISTNAVAQHKMADLLLIPNLEEFSTMDFSRPEQIILAGQKCVEQNRDAIHQLAVSLKEKGVPVVPQNYERQSVYSQLPDRIVEKIKVKDISFKEKIPLPSEKEFSKLLNCPLDSSMHQKLSLLLNKLRIRYHLASLSYEVKNGSDENHCVLEIQANHYNQDLSKIFFGGTPGLEATNHTNGSEFKIAAVTDFTTGFYITSPVELISHFSFGKTCSADLSVLPKIAKWHDASVHADAGFGFYEGSLSPKSSTSFSSDDDLGFSTHGGIQFQYIDMITSSAGIKYDYTYLSKSASNFHLTYLYFDSVISTLKNEHTDFSGFKVDLLFKSGKDQDGENIFFAQAQYRQKFEILFERTAVALFLKGANVRSPYELNSGYADFGGTNGMCGYPTFTYQRDFFIAGLEFEQKLFSVLGLPVVLLIEGKAAIKDDYDPYTNEQSPENALFHGFDNFDSIIGGFGIYFAVKVSSFNIILGGSANSRGKYTVTVGIN